MQRRNLLRTAAALPLLSAGWSRVLGAAAESGSARLTHRVRPSDAAWPDAVTWAKLKDRVGGNLLEVQPLFGACENAPNGATCREAHKYIDNPYWIADQPGGTENSGLLDAWAPVPSAYALKARNAADVAAGINFAREHNVRLVVRGGAHSYLGTSTAPDSLMIWTRTMNQVVLHDAFVGKGCEGRIAPAPAVSAGAGTVWMDLYHAVTTEGGRYVQGGGCMTVGVAGLVQGGGFGEFSKGFGTAAASLLEAEVVTADGQVRIVNDCTEPDLLWALKGGGGGTFGVVTRVTLRTHDLPEFFGGAGGTIKAASDAAYVRLIAHFMEFYRDQLFNPHWGEQVQMGPDNTLEISMQCQGLTQARVAEIWRPFFEWVSASPQELTFSSPHGAGAGAARTHWATDGNPNMILDTRTGVPKYHAWNRGNQGEVGIFLHGYDSLWLPAALLRKDQQKRLSDALFAASRHKMLRIFFNKGLAGASPEVLAATRRTSTSPAVLDGFALVIIADGHGVAYPGLAPTTVDQATARKDAREIDLAAGELRKIAPKAGSYVAESNYFNRSWARDYWGENYSRLRAIKQKYDPDGLFIVHHGVGSEEWSADGFAPVSRA
jgi:FAD/FMN-containing dehydrogenase